MRAQASLELMLIMAMVLLVVAGLLPSARRSNEIGSAMSGACTGAQKAIARLSMNYACAIDIERLSFDAGEITIYLIIQGGPPPDDQEVKDNVRGEALNYIWQALVGGFPDTPKPLQTANYTYDVSVELERVTK